MVVDTVISIIRTDTVLSLLAGKNTVKGLVVDMDVIFMSFENFCFALFLVVMIVPWIAVGIAEVFRCLKEKE